MTSSEDPIRRQLIEARTAQILDAAAQVFAAKGFHRATTKEIAKVAGVSEGTIYNYFESKGELLISLMARLSAIGRLEEEISHVQQTQSPREFFTAIIEGRVERVVQNQEILRAILPEVFTNEELRRHFRGPFLEGVVTLLEQNLESRIERGDIRPVDVPLTVRALQGMFLGLMLLRILGDELLQERWHDLPEVMIGLIFDGLNPPDGG